MSSDSLLIADLSERPRLGFKGRGTLPAMRKRGMTIEDQPNRAYRQDDGALCMVLAASEVFLIGPLAQDGCFSALEEEWRIDDGERTYPMPRRHSHAWFTVQGPATAQMMSKLCAVDLRPHRFDDLAIAQTSVARLNAIVLRADIGERMTYHLLADSAASRYFLSCLVDAAAEYRAVVASPDDLFS